MLEEKGMCRRERVKRSYEITRKFGWFRSSYQEAPMIYRALESLHCCGCSRAIVVGSLFTRHQQGPSDFPLRAKGRRPLKRPYCKACYDFVVTGEYREQ
jgi:hypothetical protein